ncbi:DyP-type peroxidase [Phlebiopsis gigantea 11061_1 CR5-6]|uniref:DyP-type peroxidase n=1 Tax=Phlebiopsis gigantea (strain 11061_1 CR5-6) TaxID=745531 RepID=A0A0C3S130_PHLG1|nr:DyP-type peroxidase [Phlebiopsis gigantea 11061_1 CR5-6]
MRLVPLLTAALSFLQPHRDVLGAAAPENHLTERQSSGRSTPLLATFPGQAVLPTLQEILTLNATNGTFLPLQNIQGDILVGMKKQTERLVFFQINSASGFRSALKTYLPQITSTATLISPAANQPLAFVNIGFSQTGLTALGITDDLNDAEFASGMWADAANLGDDPSKWVSPFKGTAIHGVFVLGSDQASYLDQYQSAISSTFGSSISVLTTISGAARPGDQAGHEHFGFLDGISQPAIGGWTTNTLPGQAIVPNGVILARRLGDTATRPSWALDGTFMAFRWFQQLVPEFNKWTLDNAVQPPPLAGVTLNAQDAADFLGARMFGRWKSGAPLDLAPTVDDPALGADPQRNNLFDYGDALLDETKCPFSAHIRKTNPRLDLPLLSINNHAIRSSIAYGPEVSASESASNTTSQDRGLIFVEYQSVIANGFRFQQIAWANTANFPPAKLETPGLDAVIGQGTPRTSGGLDPNNQTKMFTVPQFVVPKGGEYFFVPSIPALTSEFAT